MFLAILLLIIYFIFYGFQNKLLHSRLESLHIRLAEKEQTSTGYSVDSKGESDLQNVISYLRRSKEIVSVLLYFFFSWRYFIVDVLIILIYLPILL